MSCNIGLLLFFVARDSLPLHPTSPTIHESNYYFYYFFNPLSDINIYMISDIIRQLESSQHQEMNE